MNIAFQVFTKKSAMDWKKEQMLSHMPMKKSLIAVQTSSHEVPNQPRNTSNTPVSVFRILLNWLITKSQIPVKMPLIPFQHCSQFPENKPINTSSTLRMVSVTKVKISEI